MARKVKLPLYYKERQAFLRRLLSPSPLKIAGNTTYEEIGCVGFQPQFNRLEAIIFVKQEFGYGGDICSRGSTEYVRFFLSWDDGATWQDQGWTSFTAHNIPRSEEKKRLEYAVTLDIQPRKRFCFTENLPLCRAILSWNLVPPAGNPNFTPPWGEVHETTIQVDPRRFFLVAEVLAKAELKLPNELSQVIDLEKEVPALEPKELSLAELQQTYKKAKVEPHRFGLKMAKQLVEDPGFKAQLSQGIEGPIPELEIDFGSILEKLEEPAGNTSYEKLECVGLNPDRSELIATFRVFKPYGYSGGPCTKGSTEYVTFWGDFNMNGIFETCLGTAQVGVHDFKNVPDEGLEYSVFLPVDLNPYRRPCHEGPRLARIRATLSWNTPHPCNKPGVAPYWGNAEDTVIEIPPGPKADPADPRPWIYSVCNVGVCAIDPGTGEATGERPFGGTLNIAGEFPIGPAVPVANRFKYKVRVRPLDPVAGAWQTLDNGFHVWVHEGAGLGPASSTKVLQEVDSEGFYTYLEYGTPVSGSWRRVSAPNRLLAKWKSAPEVGRWEIQLIGRDTWTAPPTDYAAGVTVCPVGFRQTVTVKLDQKEPDVFIAITGYERGGTFHTAKDCDTFKEGDVLKGEYTVTDQHFRTLRMTVMPKIPAAGATVSPSTRSYPVVPTGGESGTWELDTSGMDACGYIVLLEAWDRTYAGCDADGWYNRTSIGFCLKK